jgi:predicted dehydrogenase
MSDPIRFGLLSFAHRTHAAFWAEAITTSPDALLAGIWDDNPKRGAAAARQFNTHFYPDLAGLLRECDAVGITAETAKHASLVEAAAAAGVHILLEKPMATTLDDCNRIERAVRESGVFFMQNFPKRFDPVNQELVDLVRRGRIGEVGLVRIRHGHYHGLDPDFRNQWFADPVQSGGGTLIDEGIHAADFLRWLIGEPKDVRATISHHLLHLPVEDTAAAIFTFPNGVIAEVTTSWSFIAAEETIEIFGTDGTAILSGVDLASRDFAHPPYLRIYDRNRARGHWDGSATTPAFVTGDFHQRGPRQFIACIRAGQPPAIGLDAGRRSLAMILAAYGASRTGETQIIRPNGRER